ncbi:hypothetical protein, partial [Methylobacterium indicum]
PLTTQYISPDPIGISGGFRLAGYVSNPLFFADPLGLAGCCPASGSLDWTRQHPKTGESSVDHVNKHGSDIPNRPIQSVFADDPIQTTNRAWAEAVKNGITPTIGPNGNWIYDVPYPNAGLQGGRVGASASNPILNNVRIVTLPGTNTVVTAFPY